MIESAHPVQKGNHVKQELGANRSPHRNVPKVIILFDET